MVYIVTSNDRVAVEVVEAAACGLLHSCNGEQLASARHLAGACGGRGKMMSLNLYKQLA